jgi:hypothetical protein
MKYGCFCIIPGKTFLLLKTFAVVQEDDFDLDFFFFSFFLFFLSSHIQVQDYLPIHLGLILGSLNYLPTYEVEFIPTNWNS